MVNNECNDRMEGFILLRQKVGKTFQRRLIALSAIESVVEDDEGTFVAMKSSSARRGSFGYYVVETFHEIMKMLNIVGLATPERMSDFK